MKRTRTLRIWGGFLLLLLLLLVFLIWNIFAGSVSLSASEIWRILLGSDAGAEAEVGSQNDEQR